MLNPCQTPLQGQVWGHFPHNRALVHSGSPFPGFVPAGRTAATPSHPQGWRAAKSLVAQRKNPVVHRTGRCLLLRLCFYKDIKKKTGEQRRGTRAGRTCIRPAGAARQRHRKGIGFRGICTVVGARALEKATRGPWRACKALPEGEQWGEGFGAERRSDGGGPGPPSPARPDLGRPGGQAADGRASARKVSSAATGSGRLKK